MSRTKKITSREAVRRIILKHPLLLKLVSYLLKGGNKHLNERMLFDTFMYIKFKTRKNPLKYLMRAINNVKPYMTVKPGRRGRVTYLIPHPLTSDEQITLALRWLIEAANTKRGRQKKRGTFVQRFGHSIIQAAHKTGYAYQKKNQLHALAKANQSFAHWSKL